MEGVVWLDITWAGFMGKNVNNLFLNGTKFLNQISHLTLSSALVYLLHAMHLLHVSYEQWRRWFFWCIPP